MGFGFVIPILIVGVLVYAFLNMDSLKRNDVFQRSEKDANQIIKERYARGEIDDEEYARIKRRLAE